VLDNVASGVGKKQMKLTKVVLVLWANQIPWLLVPMKYLSTYHAASY
jgi:hypothetical protein